MVTANATQKSMKEYAVGDNFTVPFGKTIRKRGNAWMLEKEFMDVATLEFIKQAKHQGANINEGDAYNFIKPSLHILVANKVLDMDYTVRSQFMAFARASNLDEALEAVLAADRLELLQDLLLEGDEFKEGVTFEYLQTHVIPAFRRHGARPSYPIMKQLRKLLQDLVGRVVEYLTTCFTQSSQATATVAVVARE
jgi:hypothetical protein